MDVSRRRAGVRCSVAAGSVWESRMKSDEVGGGVKVFSGEENAEEGGNGGTRLKRSQVGGVVSTGKRKTWKSDGLEKSQIQIARGKPEQQKSNKFERSPIHIRKLRSETQNGASEGVDSGEGPERNLGQLKKSKSDSIKPTNQSVSDGSGENAIQMRKTRSEIDHVLDEARNGTETDGSAGESGNNLIDNGKNDDADENCKDFGVCQEVISSSSENAGMVKCSPVHVGGDSDDEGEEEEEEEVVDEEIDIEMEKRSFDVKEISIPESKVVNDLQRRVVVKEPEKQKVLVNEPEPKKAVTNNKQLHKKYERPVSLPLTVKQSPPIQKNSTIYQNFSKTNSIPKVEEHCSFPQTQNKLQSLVDLIMWRDISRSAFIFGIGTFTIVSSSYAKDINLSLISVLSYMGLVYLAAIFLYKSLICRGVIDLEDTNYVVREEEAIWVLKLILPYLNEFLSKLKAMFSGDPGTTIKLAVLLFVLARCGSSITIWKMAKLGFFGVFIIPKICSSYSAQLTAYANFWIRRFRDAWDSCSHKKAVALGIFGLVWNLSSVVARIWSVFVLFVAFRYYQQHYLVRDEWVEDETSCQEPVGVGMQTQGRAPNLFEKHKVKKRLHYGSRGKRNNHLDVHGVTGKGKKRRKVAMWKKMKMKVTQMSVVADSPVHSSSSDDFIAYLDAALDASSPEASSDKEAENQDEFESIRIKRRKVENIEEIEGSTSEGIVEQNLEASVEVDVCTHPGSFGNMCIRCGQKMVGESGVTFGYIHKGLRLHDEEITRLRNTDMKNLLSRKKLYLVLDLDHTLLNSTHLVHLSPEELHLLNQTDSLGDVSKGSLFKLEYMHMMTKLRPFVHTFLKEASEMFEMYIYTMGDRPYALEMAKLLDPQGEYFNAKVISRDDGTQRHQKGLDVVLGQESAVLILDDTEHFGFNCKSLAELKSDEDETDGALAKILKMLKRVHCTFFDKLHEDLVDRDVRQVLSSLRNEVLSGCVIIFSRIFHAALPSLKKMAEQMGATCLTELDPSVTHVVATDAGTEKSRWAVKENKFLVHPRWIEAANFFWQKQPEEDFFVKKLH
ncbi:Reticulon [Sesbania bispinosa]|nr:Reticulon [Sesbania bispinosa]